MNKCLCCEKETINPKFCSRSCAASYNNSKFPKRTQKPNGGMCIICGADLYGNHTKFCNNKCLAKHSVIIRQDNYIDAWLSGKVSGAVGESEYAISKRVRRYLLEQAKYKCCLCGWCEKNKFTDKIPLEIHHIDGNWKNNSKENLVVLCPNCHSLTNSYRGNNARRGRGSSMRGSRLYKNAP